MHFDNAYTLILTINNSQVFEGVYIISDDPIYTIQDKHNGEKFILATVVDHSLALINKEHLNGACTQYYVKREQRTRKIICPFQGPNHDDMKCQMYRCDVAGLDDSDDDSHTQTLGDYLFYVKCSGKIKKVNGKLAGQSTKPAIRAREDDDCD